MKQLIFTFIAIGSLCTLSSFSCKGNNQAQSQAGRDTIGITLPPVETLPPNTPAYKPAFAGQTRTNGVKTTTPVEAKIIAENIGKPWAIVNYPGDKFLITDKSGFMQIFSKDGQVLNKITGFPVVDDRGQGGLLDVALDPDFAKNRTIYWAFSEKRDDGLNLTAVGKGKISADETTIENPVVIFRAEPYLKSTLHFGSRLAFDKAGNLFVTAGERSELEGRVQAQDLHSGLGKVFRITKEGKPAPGNPFINTPGAKPEIYSYGHRNPQGFVIHPATGELWLSEMGPKGGDEINLIKAGKNYGWPVITYGIEYSGKTIGDGITQKEGMEQPVYYWDPSPSPSGIDFYTAKAVPEWNNNLFIGMLGGQHIDRLVIDKGKVTGEERLLADMKERFRDLVAAPDGAIYAVTDSGKIIRLGKK